MAKALPLSVAPVVIVMDAEARMLPSKTELVPRVAEVPTCQKMLAGLAPFIRIIPRPDEVVREVPIWKMKTAFGLPWASRVRLPEDIAKEEVDL